MIEGFFHDPFPGSFLYCRETAFVLNENRILLKREDAP